MALARAVRATSTPAPTGLAAQRGTVTHVVAGRARVELASMPGVELGPCSPAGVGAAGDVVLVMLAGGDYDDPWIVALDPV